MRPDCSLRVQLVDSGDVADDVWLHFDAKYRLERLERFARQDETVSAQDEVASEEEEAESVGASKREDLLKMHAYRDAIRRSAAAYVLYPGEGPPTLFLEEGEILPGLGAFPLKPAADGSALGTTALRVHVRDVLDHFASQITQHERSRYWRGVVFSGDVPPLAPVSASSFLERPPADVDVLLGFVRSREHWAWIRENAIYNLRAGDRRGAVHFGGRELGADLLLLYDASGSTWRTLGVYRRRGAWRALSRADLEALGYPRPGGDYYFCAEVAEVETPEWLNSIPERFLASIHGRTRGAPTVVTWQEIMEGSA
jgi:hypothetical protein